MNEMNIEAARDIVQADTEMRKLYEMRPTTQESAILKEHFESLPELNTSIAGDYAVTIFRLLDDTPDYINGNVLAYHVTKFEQLHEAKIKTVFKCCNDHKLFVLAVKLLVSHSLYIIHEDGIEHRQMNKKSCPFLNLTDFSFMFDNTLAVKRYNIETILERLIEEEAYPQEYFSNPTLEELRDSVNGYRFLRLIEFYRWSVSDDLHNMRYIVDSVLASRDQNDNSENFFAQDTILKEYSRLMQFHEQMGYDFMHLYEPYAMKVLSIIYNRTIANRR